MIIVTLLMAMKKFNKHYLVMMTKKKINLLLIKLKVMTQERYKHGNKI